MIKKNGDKYMILNNGGAYPASTGGGGADKGELLGAYNTYIIQTYCTDHSEWVDTVSTYDGDRIKELYTDLVIGGTDIHSMRMILRRTSDTLLINQTGKKLYDRA